MRIALLYHQFIARGGLEGYLRDFAARLRAAGHELVLVTARADDSTVKSLDAEVRLIPPALTSLGTLRNFAERSADLIPDLKAGAVLGFGRTWRQDIHRAGGGCHWHYSRMLPWWKRWRAKNRWELAAERRLYTGGTRLFVVNSAKVRDELAEAYQVPAERVRIIRTAVDTEHWRPAADPGIRAALREKLGFPGDAPLFLFASLDHRRKGLGALLEALARVPEARLQIVGQKLDASWRARIRRLGLDRRVAAAERAPLLPWFQAADWFVHPTRYDACANTVLQSMACALPGIISAGDGASELILHGGNGLILQNPADSGELAAHLRAALALAAADRARLAAAARDTVLPLTWAAHLGEWMRALDSL